MKARKNIARLPFSLLALLLVVLAFWPMRSDLLIAWNSEEYGHGMIIPFIAALMGWHILHDTAQKPSPSWCGPIVLLISSGMLLIAVLAAFQAAAHYGFILALIGICLTFWGIKITCALLPAFIYVFFAVPLPHLLYANLSQELQLFSSTMGVKILELLGISVYQEGNIIDLGTYKLQVVEACSGLRYLFPLVSFSYLASYLMQDKAWKRALVFLSSIPITIGMNTLRIALIGITVELWGPQMAEGVLHQLEGWVIFSLCAVILLCEAQWLMRNTGHFRFEIFAFPSGNRNLQKIKPCNRYTAIYLASLVITMNMAFVFGTGVIEKRTEIIPKHPALSAFPQKIANWTAREQSLDNDILASLQLSDYWLADYTDTVNETPSPINLYIAYYANQRTGASTHSPSHCIPGGGWQVENKSRIPITLENGKTMTVSRMLIRRGTVAQLVYFWFSERGRTLPETSYAKWYLLIDSITLGRSDGALIRLTTPLNKGETTENVDKRLQRFMNHMEPSLETFIPGRNLITQEESPAP